jgi:uncharacterized protein YndB with AHSA1/START domain
VKLRAVTEGTLLARDGLAELRFVHGDIGLRFDRTYDVGVAQVWTALTDPESLERWVGEVRGGPLGRGVRVSVEPYGRSPVSCTVAYVDPERMIEVGTSADAPGGWRVVAEIVALTDTRTLTVVEVRGVAENAAAACAGWWHGRLADLGALLDGLPASERTGRAVLVEEYAAALALLLGDD